MPLLGTCSWGEGWLNLLVHRLQLFPCHDPDPLLDFKSPNSSFPVLLEIRQIISLLRCSPISLLVIDHTFLHLNHLQFQSLLSIFLGVYWNLKSIDGLPFLSFVVRRNTNTYYYAVIPVVAVTIINPLQ